MTKSSIYLCAGPDKRAEHTEFINELKQSYTVLDLEKNSTPGNILLLGGDGSLNYLLNNYPLELITKSKVIYFPTGTANDFAKSLKTAPLSPKVESVVDILRSNMSISVPIMSCNDRYFINVATAGAPAKVTNSGEDLLKKATGKLSYYILSLEQLLSPDEYEINYSSDGKEASLRTNGFIISQGLYAGGGIKVSSSYTPNFGESFNFLAVKNTDVSTSVSSVIELQKSPSVVNEENLCNEFSHDLSITGDKEIPLKLDGEEYSSKSLSFKKLDLSIDFFLH